MGVISRAGIATDDTAALALETIGLCKSYDGRALALDSLNLSVARGTIFGFLGPNGAGKSTTIRLLMDLIRPTSGSARVLGLDCQADPVGVKALVGYLPGEPSVYSNYSANQLVSLISSLRPGRVDEGFVSRLCERLAITRQIPVGQMSHGNRQKVGLLGALASQPPLVILDEPTNGLDPLIQIELVQVLRDLRDEGTTVFLSSHNLTEVERLCDQAAIIKSGKLVAVEQIDALKTRRLQRITVTFADTAPTTDLASISGISNVRVEESSGSIVRLDVTGDLDAVVKALARSYVVSIETERSSLEDTFLAYYQESDSEQPSS